jgi:hypothetical protein
MRTVFFILMLGLLSTSSPAQESVADFYRKFKKQEDVTNLKLPGWLVWVGTGLVYNSIRDEETRIWLHLARKMGRFRLLQSEHPQNMTDADLTGFVTGLKTHSGYDDIIYVRNEDSNLNVMIREGQKGRLKELLIVGSNDGETLLLSMKTRLRMKDISEVLDHYLKHLGWKDKAKKKLPQA